MSPRNNQTHTHIQPDAHLLQLVVVPADVWYLPAAQFTQALLALDPATLDLPALQPALPPLPPGQYQPTGHSPPTGLTASAMRPEGQKYPGAGSTHWAEGVAPPGQ